jgi:L-fucose isomerase-like protein
MIFNQIFGKIKNEKNGEKKLAWLRSKFTYKNINKHWPLQYALMPKIFLQSLNMLTEMCKMYGAELQGE